MAATHLLAAIAWSMNPEGRPISVESTCDAGAQLTMETRTNSDTERDQCLSILRRVVETWRRGLDRAAAIQGAEHVVFRPDGSPVCVTVPSR